MIMKKIYLAAFISLSIPLISLAQSKVVPKMSLDTNKILIGDQVNLKLQLSYPSKTIITWPSLKDSLSSHVEIIKKSKIDTLNNSGGNLKLGQTLTITSFDSGSFYIPPVTFKYKGPDDTGYFDAITDSLLINVSTLAVDTTKAIKDIKGPLSVPLTWLELLPYLIGVVLLIAILLFVIYYLRRRKKGLPLIGKPVPKLPPHEEALLALKNLQEKKLWQNNKVKEYYSELTDIIRTYIEKRFEVTAMEMTTDEIMAALKPIEIDSLLKSRLNAMLRLADMVKFAKASPLPNEHDISLTLGFDFVNDTKPVVVEETPADKTDVTKEGSENV